MALKDAKLVELAGTLKIDLIGGPPKILADKQMADSHLWGTVIKDANIKLD